MMIKKTKIKLVRNFVFSFYMMVEGLLSTVLMKYYGERGKCCGKNEVF